MGPPVSRPLPSPEWSGAGSPEAAQTPTQPCTISLLQAPPPPLLLFICLLTKQKLQSPFALFLYVKCPPPPYRSCPVSTSFPPTCQEAGVCESWVLGFEMEGWDPFLLWILLQSQLVPL